MALFGMTAKQWRDSHPGDKGNIRTTRICHARLPLNLENLNALFIRKRHYRQSGSQVEPDRNPADETSDGRLKNQAT